LNRRSQQRSINIINDTTHIHHEFVYVDARRVITIDEDAIQDGAVVWHTSEEKFKQLFDDEVAKLDAAVRDSTVLHFVITGYVAININGVAVTLKRDGSDYSAAIMGKILRANSISIWTDVDGVLSADPRRVPLANVLPEVSYDEAMELAYFGAKVIHPRTMQPAVSCEPQIPIYIRNTFRPSLPGTRIFNSATTYVLLTTLSILTHLNNIHLTKIYLLSLVMQSEQNIEIRWSVDLAVSKEWPW
jgi:aspartokinase/homoserine dehydrogenase 1